VLLLLQIPAIFVNIQITSLNALDNPKKSFISTSLAAGTNIVLNVLLIPVLGILGAAVATLLSVFLNAVLSYSYLSRIIPVRLEKKPVGSIVVSGVVMGTVVLAFSILTGISSVLLLIAAVLLGAGVYFALLFRLDPGIRSEAVGLLETFGIL
jgi:O-antigen/teichoic acid export membrane protein